MKWTNLVQYAMHFAYIGNNDAYKYTPPVWKTILPLVLIKRVNTALSWSVISCLQKTIFFASFRNLCSCFSNWIFCENIGASNYKGKITTAKGEQSWCLIGGHAIQRHTKCLSCCLKLNLERFLSSIVVWLVIFVCGNE